MMIIVNEKYYITTDKYNYTLYRKPNKINEKTGKPMVDRRLGYYPSLANCLYSILLAESMDYVDENDVSLQAVMDFEKQLAQELLNHEYKVIKEGN